MAEDAAGNQEPGIFDGIDLDPILRGFDDNPFSALDFDLFDEPWILESGSLPYAIRAPNSSSLGIPDPPGVESGSLNDIASFVSSGETYQLGEPGVEREAEAPDFFSKVPFDSSDRVTIVPVSPKAYDGQGMHEEEETPFVAGIENHDRVDKELKKKIRNRESAFKSRERKKAYTKELEMNSKYLESECHRLDYLLRCCIAENMVLRESCQLEKKRLCGASMAKQESAVLFVESLLLVSLFWLTSITRLFFIPGRQCANAKALDREGRRAFAPQLLKIKSSTGEKLRRFKGLRPRMKQLFLRLIDSISSSTCTLTKIQHCRI